MLASTIRPINLRPNQVEHFKRVLQILTRFYFYIDGSEMGSGKTYVAAAVAITLGLPCLVFCPKGARENWQRVFTQHGVQTYQITKDRGIITYETLRSTKSSTPGVRVLPHGLLTRSDTSAPYPEFSVTQTYTQIIQAGVFIIFDEAQKLKNDSDQHHAVATLIRHFYSLSAGAYGTVTNTPAPNIKSRFALLSASLIDKPQHVLNLLEIVGFMNPSRSSTLSNISLQEIISRATQINSTGTSQFMITTPLNPGAEGVIDYVYQLFLQIIRPAVMSTIPRAITNAIKDVRNGYYTLTPEEEIVYNNGINALIKALQMRRKRKEIREVLKLIGETGETSDPATLILQSNLQQSAKNDLGNITNALVLIEQAKMNSMIRVARQILALTFTYQGRTITPKLILFADYYRVIDYLFQNLTEYQPVELTGRVSEDQRTRNIRAFQDPSNQNRLLIGNPLVGGLAVSLHDTTGLFPRFMFIMPNFRVNELHQATGRIFREGVAGVAIIRFFYGKSRLKEISVLDALARKGETLKEVHTEQSQYGVKFPSEYPDEDESQLIPNFINLFLQAVAPPTTPAVNLMELPDIAKLTL